MLAHPMWSWHSGSNDDARLSFGFAALLGFLRVFANATAADGRRHAPGVEGASSVKPDDEYGDCRESANLRIRRGDWHKQCFDVVDFRLAASGHFEAMLGYWGTLVPAG